MTRSEVIATIEKARVDCMCGNLFSTAESLGKVLEAFETMNATAASILGAKGGKTPPKPGSRPRGRPRKQPKGDE